MEIVIDKSIKENAAMLKGCKVGQQVQMTGKIIEDDDEEAVVKVASLYKDKAPAPDPEDEGASDVPGPEEAGEPEPEPPAPKKSGGPMAVVLGYVAKKKR